MTAPEILYEDNHLLVVNKPAGILTQPSGTEQENLEHICKAWLKKKYGKPGHVFLEAVHRLDKPVSGIVVFARTSKALSRLQASIRGKAGRKLYHALVENAPKQPEGTLEHFLVHDDHRASVVEKSTPDAKLARLHYRSIGQRGKHALLEVELDTGRSHQIRAQLSAIGCPIIGDEKYGARSWGSEKKIALHHFRMQLPHPVTHEMLTFEAPDPF